MVYLRPSSEMSGCAFHIPRSFLLSPLQFIIHHSSFIQHWRLYSLQLLKASQNNIKPWGIESVVKQNEKNECNLLGLEDISLDRDYKFWPHEDQRECYIEDEKDVTSLCFLMSAHTWFIMKRVRPINLPLYEFKEFSPSNGVKCISSERAVTNHLLIRLAGKLLKRYSYDTRNQGIRSSQIST
jgi:hypothetical protein